MVNLKLEDDGHKRNKGSFFQAIGHPSPNSFLQWVDFAHEYIENYDWGDRPKPKPFRNLLLTPVYFGKRTELFGVLKDLKDRGVVDNIMFDSGGFQVLTGALKSKGVENLDDLQKLNEKLYNEYDWADIYIMPDHPPNKLDVHHKEYKEKIDNTIEASLKFFDVLKPEVQGKVAPVFHPQKDTDIDYIYQAYKPILDKSGFASYSASALTLPGSPRQLRGDVLIMLNELRKYLEQKNIDLHCLGISSPPAVFMLHHMKIKTFDASTPIIGAGLGKIFFPYHGGVSCSLFRENEPDNLTAETLIEFREKTGHRCPFCEDISKLKRESKTDDIPGYLYRRMHNFCVQDELNWLYNDFNFDMLEKFAPSQYKDLTNLIGAKQITLF